MGRPGAHMGRSCVCMTRFCLPQSTRHFLLKLLKAFSPSSLLLAAFGFCRLEKNGKEVESILCFYGVYRKIMLSVGTEGWAKTDRQWNLESAAAYFY